MKDRIMRKTRNVISVLVVTAAVGAASRLGVAANGTETENSIGPVATVTQTETRTTQVTVTPTTKSTATVTITPTVKPTTAPVTTAAPAEPTTSEPRVAVPPATSDPATTFATAAPTPTQTLPAITVTETAPGGAVNTRPATTFVTYWANEGGQAKIDECTGGFTNYLPSSKVMDGKLFLLAHVNCGGAPVLDLWVGDYVIVDDIAYVVIDKIDMLLEVGALADEPLEPSADAYMQTCWPFKNPDGTQSMRVVSLKKLT